MTILVAIEAKGDETNLAAVAADLAETYGVDLIALHVLPTGEFLEKQQDVNAIDEVEAKPIQRHERNAAETARSVVEDAVEGVDVRGEGRIGDPEDEIVAAADEFDATYVVIGGRRRSPIGKAVFGSTAQAVLLNADRPVVTVLTG